MKHRIAVVTVLAGLTLGASGALASSVTTNSYSASSTAADIRASCKELFVRSGGELKAKCNKANERGTVSAVLTYLNMPKYANCRKDGNTDWYTIQWGEYVTGIRPTDPAIVVSSTGDTYLLRAGCKDKDGDGTSWAPTTLDIGETTDGLKNDAGSIVKR